MTNQDYDPTEPRQPAKQIETDSTIKSAGPKNKAYILNDGRGLHLLIKPNGSKLWRFRYTHEGRQRVISLGSYPAVGLAQARRLRELHHADIADGIAPVEKRRQEKLEQAAKTLTFKVVAERWYIGNTELAAKPWAAATARKVRIYLEKDFYPAIGNKPIADVTRMDLIAINEQMEKRGAFDASKKAREWMAAIFDDALDRGEIPHNPAHRLKAGHRAKGIETVPNPNVGFKGLPDLLRAVDSSGAHALMKCYVRLLALIACRPGELRLAQWPEFDLQKAVWKIPADRMKARAEQQVPLSRQALELLEQVRTLRPEGHLFIVQGEKPLTDMAGNMLLKRLGYTGRQTLHGFRHLLSTELHERGYSPDWIEVQLAHKIEGMRGVYNGAEYLEQRRAMMQGWADSIDAAMAGASVVAINQKRA